VFLLVGFSLSWGAAIVVLLDPFLFRSEIIDWTEGRVSSLYFWIRLRDWSEAIHDFTIEANHDFAIAISFLVLCALCFVLCALCFVLYALCFVLCALCFVWKGVCSQWREAGALSIERLIGIVLLEAYFRAVAIQVQGSFSKSRW
jgi:hypothetical protein